MEEEEEEEEFSLSSANFRAALCTSVRNFGPEMLRKVWFLSDLKAHRRH
jgi:hypothetical protein